MTPSSRLRTVLAVGTLVAVGGSAQAQLGPVCDAARELESASSTLLDLAAQRPGVDPALETGAVMDELVKKLVGVTCEPSEVADWLVTTCSPFGEVRGLVDLRRRLVRDLARSPGTIFQKYGHELSEARRRELLLSSAVLDTLITTARVADLAQRMEAYAVRGVDLSTRNLCTTSQEPAPPLRRRAAEAVVLRIPPLDRGVLGQAAPQPVGTSPVVTAARIVTWLAAEDLSKPESHYVVQIEEKLAREGRAVDQGKLSHVQRQAAGALVQSVRELRRGEKRLTAGARDERVRAAGETLDRLVETVEHAMTLSLGTLYELPGWVEGMIEAALLGDVGRAIDSLVESVRPLTLPQAIPSRVLDAYRTVTRLAEARDEDEAKRAMAGLIIPLGPWVEDILFDVNAVLPVLEGGEARVAGDVLLGYNAKTWGIAGRGAIAYYDFSNQTALSNTARFGGGADLWGVVGKDSSVKMDGRLLAEYVLYDSELADVSGASSNAFSQETSVMYRGSILAGLRAQPGERFAFGIWIGGGGQFEAYDPLTVGAAGVTIREEEKFTALFRGRLRIQWLVVPSYFAARVRVDAARYGITRDAVAIQVTGGTVATTDSSVQSTELEVASRVHLDAEVARFVGFVPGLTGGVDYFARSADGAPSVSEVVPVFGIGIRRESF